ncbi:putative AT-hook motif nuclear-localized protein [Helianthus debilis subsp. tardiflorus]
MNGSEQGEMFQSAMTPVTSQPPVRSARLPYPGGGYNVATDVTGGSGGVGLHQNININEYGGGETMVKRRGRPRKYGPNGSVSPPAVGAAVAGNVAAGNVMVASLNGGLEEQQQARLAAAVPPISAAPVSSVPMEEGFASVKKGRGRPPGSLNKKPKGEAVGSSGFGFTPHIIVVQPGEDVLNKIMSFAQNGPRAICIMSGIGVINNVTLRQAATSGGTATYEGRFDILSLSGSFVLSEASGQRTRTGGLSITLNDGSNARVFGGVVAGLLTAASPVQVIVGSLIPENRKEPLLAIHGEPSANHGMGPSSPPSHGTLSESSGGPGSPVTRGNELSSQDMTSMPWK